MPKPPVRSSWSDLPLDTPMPLLERRRIIGEQAMISHIVLRKGCIVPVHSHENEQFSALLSGRMRFTFGDGAVPEIVLLPGQVIHLPSNCPHGAEALEESVILDIFAPPSAMTGIDRR